MTPTQRTLRYLKSHNMPSGIVERWIAQARRRIDLFGFVDIIALDLSRGKIIAVQSCGSSFSAHRKKIESEPRADQWRACGGEIWLIGWRKVKVKRGGKAMKWEPRIELMGLGANES